MQVAEESFESRNFDARTQVLRLLSYVAPRLLRSMQEEEISIEGVGSRKSRDARRASEQG